MKNKRLLALITVLFLSFSLAPAASAFSYADMSAEFGISGYEITKVAPETNYISLSASNESGKQNINAVEFNPQNPYTSLRAGKSAGYVYSTQTVNTIANNMSDTNGGDVAVAAINGDFFSFGVGVPHGIFIDEGRILSTPPQYYAAFGLTYDNKPFITRHGTILDKEFRINGILCDITGINNAHAKNADSLMLYTSDYARGTKTGTEAYELLCRVNFGDVRHGETLNFTIEEVFDAVGNTTLRDGYIVLSAQGTRINDLKKLSVGETHEISFRFNEFWSNVKFAVGGIELLLKDGEIYSTADSSNEPRTSVGIRPDGTVVMATFDGRQDDAKGMSYKTAAQAMRALGCTDALNLDGGGSTTFVLRAPGEKQTSIVNKVSGSSPRQVANALVLMNTAPTGRTENITISPKSRTVLAGGAYTFRVSGAYDENFKPTSIPSDITWETDLSGIIDANGTFYADEAGVFDIFAQSGNITATASIKVCDRVDAIIPDTNLMIARAGDSFELSASAMLDGKKVEASNEQFTWSAPETLGFFTAPGKFTLSETAVKGEITISYGETSATVKVEPETPPVPITGFEGDEVSFIPAGIGTKVNPNSKYEIDPKFVYSDNRSLKVYYNFLNTEGSVGSYYAISPDSADNSAYNLTNIPKKLGMFVYGDGSGITLRSILEETSGKQHYVSFGKIEHIGWKYMEAEIPTDIVSPIYIKAPVNLVSNPEKLTHGCLYFDNLRAVYSDTADDVTPPTITKAWPSEGMMTYGRNPSIGVILADSDTGIDPESVQIHVNGYNCTDRLFDETTGKISYTVKNALKPGYHSIYIRARDKAGNLLSREWKFEVR